MSLNHARVDRLMQVYWPEDFVDYYIENDPWEAKPIRFVAMDRRDKHEDYDVRRVRHFIDRLAAGEELEPIEVDCRWHHGSPGRPEILDGHHRYMAAVIMGCETIPMSFGGICVVGEWLAGIVDEAPPEAGL
jgi:hypothetical protein